MILVEAEIFTKTDGASFWTSTHFIEKGLSPDFFQSVYNKEGTGTQQMEDH